MPIEGVHTIEGRGTVATGKVEQGVIASGTRVEILGLGGTLETVVTSVEQFNRLLERAVPARTWDCCCGASSQTRSAVVRSWPRSGRSRRGPGSGARFTC